MTPSTPKLGTLLSWNSPFGDPHAFSTGSPAYPDSPEGFAQWLKHHRAISLPVYLRNHTFHTDGTGDWIGYIYATLPAIRARLHKPRLTRTMRHQAALILRAELNQLSA